MTFQEIREIMDEFNIAYNYYQWPVNDAPAPPYLLFYYPRRNDFAADNLNYSPITAWNVELLTDEKDFSLEAQVEAVLNSHFIPFSKTETYIDSEKMYLVLYEMEVFINA